MQKALINTRSSILVWLEDFYGTFPYCRLVQINYSHMLLVQHSFPGGNTLMTSFKQANLSKYLAHWQNYHLKGVHGN